MSSPSIPPSPSSPPIRETPTGLAARLLWAVYRTTLSPILHAISPSQCLYRPTCSEYAYVALVRHGALRGGWLALRRLARCHPFARGCFDPVPGGDSTASPSVSIPADHLP